MCHRWAPVVKPPDWSDTCLMCIYIHFSFYFLPTQVCLTLSTAPLPVVTRDTTKCQSTFANAYYLPMTLLPEQCNRHTWHLHITPRYLRICFKTSLVRTNACAKIFRTRFRPTSGTPTKNQRKRQELGATTAPLARAAIFLFLNGDRRKMAPGGTALLLCF